MTLSLDRQNAYRARYRQERSGWLPATDVYEQIIRDRLRPESRVLDLGCGRGGVLEQLGAAVYYAVGFDPDLQSLREHRVVGLPRAAALADHLPLHDASFDVIACSWVLEHVADPNRVFAEAARVLRHGGSFVFLTPNSTSLVAWLNRILKPLQQVLVPKLYGRAEADTFPVMYRANTHRQIVNLAANTGLQVDLLRHVEDPTYLAFHPLLYRVSVALSRITPPVHLVGALKKA
jgi:SAM-dependent methyltransferase